MSHATREPAPSAGHLLSASAEPAIEVQRSAAALRPVLLAMFFLSGLSALIYQVAWARMLGLVFGVTSFAVATVLSAFMGGLALGSLVGGRIVDKRRSPLLAFACLELGIGVTALLFPLGVSGLTAAFVAVRQHWAGTFYLFSLLRFLLAFSVLLIPTTLMGATLPVLVRAYVARPGRLGSDVAALYAANNWGAVLGALAAAFVLVRALGVRETTYLAAAVNAAVGLGALYLSLRAPGPAPAARPAAEDLAAGSAPYPRGVIYLVLCVFALEGFTSLAYEVVWTRILSASFIVVTVYAYGLVVATFIAGLAIGSTLVRRVVDTRQDVLKWVAGIEIGIGLSAALLLPLFKTAEAFALAPWVSGHGWLRWTILVTAGLGVLMLIPTTLMGATFPLVSRFYAVNFRELGRRIGLLGCLDTVGSIAGAFAGGFVLIPLLGMHRSVMFVASINVALGALVIMAHPHVTKARRGVLAVGLVLVCVGVYSALPHDVRFVPWNLSRPNFETGEGNEIISYIEGHDATVVVSHRYRDDHRVVAVNGGDVAGTGRLLETTQISQAHLPMLVYEGLNGRPAKRALTIGLGSGGTCYSLSRYDLETIHCVELVRGVWQTAREQFGMLNHGVFEDPRLTVFLEDARTYLLATDEVYDVIMDDSVHPGFEGNASLYSRDFFEHCRRRLAPGGVMSVWMPVFLMSTDDLKMVYRSFRDVFPHATLWCPTNCLNKHMVLVGAQRTLELDFARVRDRMADPEVRADLARVDLDDPYVLLDALLLDEAALAAYAGEGRAHTDNRPYLAYSSARSLREFRLNDPWIERVFEMRAMRGGAASHLVNLGETPEEVARNVAGLRLEMAVARLLNVGFAHEGREREKEAVAAALEGLALNPSSGSCRYLLGRAATTLALRDLKTGNRARALEACLNALQRAPEQAELHMTMAEIQLAFGDLAQAIAEAEEAIRLAPLHYMWHYHAAGLYFQVPDPAKALEHLEILLPLFPENRVIRTRYADAREMVAAARRAAAVPLPAPQ
jgi:spermidine synthase